MSLAKDLSELLSAVADAGLRVEKTEAALGLQKGFVGLNDGLPDCMMYKVWLKGFAACR